MLKYYFSIELVKNEYLNGLILALIMTIIIFISIIIIGWLINKLEIAQIELLSKLTGPKFANIFFNRVLFLGTIIHELSHALFATLSGAKVTKIKLFNFKDDVLGYVNYMTQGNKLKQAFQMSLTSCAPTVAGISIDIFVVWYMLNFKTNIATKLLLIFVLLCVTDHMSMSNLDIKNYIKGFAGYAILATSLNYLLFLIFM